MRRNDRRVPGLDCRVQLHEIGKIGTGMQAMRGSLDDISSVETITSSSDDRDQPKRGLELYDQV